MPNYKLTDIEGSGVTVGKKLNTAGIKSVNGLLKEGATKKGRKKLAEASGIDESKILTFVNMADLYRVKGIGSEYSELLVKAGVDSVKELSKRKPANLTQAMEDLNSKKKLVRAVPTLKRVEGWVESAKSLDKVVSH